MRSPPGKRRGASPGAPSNRRQLQPQESPNIKRLGASAQGAPLSDELRYVIRETARLNMPGRKVRAIVTLMPPGRPAASLLARGTVTATYTVERDCLADFLADPRIAAYLENDVAIVAAFEDQREAEKARKHFALLGAPVGGSA
jgi:hypothetical protein